TEAGKILGRGKVDIGVYCDDSGREMKTHLNTSVMQSYYTQLKSFCDSNGIRNSDLIASIVRLPEVVSSELSTMDEDEWLFISALLNESLLMTDEYRKREGLAQLNFFQQVMNEILSQQEMLVPLLVARNARLRNRLAQGLKELLKDENVDQNRLEQELILYVERWDVAEELQRLQQNCQHFLEELSGEARGRTLGFIAQEIGREINTIGSKANDFEMQKIVVVLKESLEQVKEQLANVL
ncbi:MAG: endoribonuclease YicC domain-containing protein, partial [Flavobacteriales bacterium]